MSAKRIKQYTFNLNPHTPVWTVQRNGMGIFLSLSANNVDTSLRVRRRFARLDEKSLILKRFFYVSTEKMT